MLVSSTSMKAANATTTAMTHGLYFGRQRSTSGSTSVSALADINLRNHRHARPQTMILVLAGIDIDAHRNALHDFHVIAGRIFRREQAETGARSPPYALHFSVVLAAISIHAERHLLPRLHAAQLGFFEIGSHPKIVHRHQRHQLLSRRDVVAHFHGFLADDSAHRRDNGAVAE